MPCEHLSSEAREARSKAVLTASEHAVDSPPSRTCTVPAFGTAARPTGTASFAPGDGSRMLSLRAPVDLVCGDRRATPQGRRGPGPECRPPAHACSHRLGCPFSRPRSPAPCSWHLDCERRLSASAASSLPVMASRHRRPPRPLQPVSPASPPQHQQASRYLHQTDFHYHSVAGQPRALRNRKVGLTHRQGFRPVFSPAGARTQHPPRMNLQYVWEPAAAHCEPRAALIGGWVAVGPAACARGIPPLKATAVRTRDEFVTANPQA